VVLFVLPFSIRLIWLLALPYPYLSPDELIYPHAGRSYVNAIGRGDFAAFRINAEHPPLAKLILGLVLTLTGVESNMDILISRILCAILSSLTCLVLWFHLKQYGGRRGIIGWFLLSLDPISIRYSGALLDVVSTLFVTVLMHIVLSMRSNSLRRSVAVGLFSALAVLSKYSALPVLLGVYLMSLLVTDRKKKPENRVATLTAFALTSFLGNPLLWPPAILGYSGFEAILSSISVYSLNQNITFVFDWLSPAILAPVRGQMLFYTSILLSYVGFLPFRLFAETSAAWIILVCIICYLRRKRSMCAVQRSIVPWVVSPTLFFWLVAKSRIESYYAVMLSPPLTILACLMLPPASHPLADHGAEPCRDACRASQQTRFLTSLNRSRPWAS
jgi:predicted membrane-bound dolichyl-phosphate-mannose-protein mannosyltransferase